MSRVPSGQEQLIAQLARIKEVGELSLRVLARQTGLSSSALSRFLAGQLDFPHTYAETCRAAGLDEKAKALHERTIELARKLGRPRDERRARQALS